jgi:hypothetical protein
MSFQVRQQVTYMAGKQLEPSDLAGQSIDISPRQTRGHHSGDLRGAMSGVAKHAVFHSSLGRRMTVRGPDFGGAAAAAAPAFFATCVLVSVISMNSRRRRPGCRTTRPMCPGSAAVVSRSPNRRLFARKMNTAVRRQGNQVCGGEHVAGGHDLAQVPAIAHLLVQGVSHSSGNPPKARCNSRLRYIERRSDLVAPMFEHRHDPIMWGTVNTVRRLGALPATIYPIARTCRHTVQTPGSSDCAQVARIPTLPAASVKALRHFALRARDGYSARLRP